MVENFFNYKGRLITVFNPPIEDGESLISPPCDRIMSLEIVIPNPLSPFNLLREGSKVKKGLKTSS